jgi:serine/threonine-protein kinase
MLNQKGDDPSVDDLVMSAAALALASPAEKRESYIHGACGGDPELIRQVRDYLEWEERMNGFLEESLFAPDEPPFQRGDLADRRFDILRDAGEGGMGWVYEGWDKQLNCRVAIKCSKAGFHKRLPPEVLHAREIAHGNVCKVFDIHTAQTRQGEIEFISMEFLEGETLAARLAHGPLSRKEALALARQICAGLAEAHRKGVVHGDVKSNNVILTKDVDGHERAVITDFGLARTPGTAGVRGTAQSMAGGAMEYMAPEVWNGGKATRASDVYGLGVILCELFAGRRPFGPDAHIEQRFKGKPPAMGTKWDRVLARCLEPDPERRFQSTGEVAEAIERKVAQGKKILRLYLAAAAAAMLVIVVSIGTYRAATAPQETVRLALLPFAGDAESAALVQGALLDAGNRLSHVKSSRTRRLTVIPVTDALQNKADQPAKARTLLGATSALTGEWRRNGDRIEVSAHLIDTSSLAHLQDWQAVYSKNELQNIPVALAGMVTSTLRLPPLAAAATVNPAAYSYYVQGVALARRDPDVDRAIALLERAVQLDSASPLTFAKLAEAQWIKYTMTKELKWQERALRALASAERLNRDVVEVLLVSGMVQRDVGHYPEAEKSLRRALDLDPNSGDVWRQLGRVYEDSGQSDSALQAYKKAIEAQPEYFKNYQVLGAYYFIQGDYEEDARQQETVVRLAPGLAGAHYSLAAAYLNMDSRDRDAEHELLTARNIEDTANVELGLGVLRLYQNRPGEAIPFIEQAIKLNSAPIYYIDLGTAYRRGGDSKRADESYGKGLEVARGELNRNPSDAYTLACQAYLNARLNHRQQAEEDIGFALNFSREAMEVRWMAIQTYEVFEEHDEALALLADAPASIFFRVKRSPDLTRLVASPGYQRLLASRNIH